ncbi:immunity protein YezG family protein [Pseudogracilibacillus sp. SE30717A]
MNFNYDNLSNSDPPERKTIWKSKNLDILPKSNSGTKLLEDYLFGKDN